MPEESSTTPSFTVCSHNTIKIPNLSSLSSVDTWESLILCCGLSHARWACKRYPDLSLYLLGHNSVSRDCQRATGVSHPWWKSVLNGNIYLFTAMACLWLGPPRGSCPGNLALKVIILYVRSQKGPWDLLQRSYNEGLGLALVFTFCLDVTMCSNSILLSSWPIPTIHKGPIRSDFVKPLFLGPSSTMN